MSGAAVTVPFPKADRPVAPIGLAPKLPRLMARKKFLKLLRLMRYAKEAHLTAVFLCSRCQKPAALKRGGGLIEGVGAAGGVNEKADRFVITCDCTIWTVGA